MVKYLLVLCSLITAAYANPSFRNHNTRIVDGYNATQGQFPYLVSIRDRFNEHFCGGTIINDRWILTAAHCVYSLNKDDLEIVAGVTNLREEGQRYKIEKVITDEDIDDIVWIPDISLVKLTTPMEFNEYAHPIPLETEDVPGDVDVIIAGWGNTETNLPQELQYITVKSVGLVDCKSAHFPVPVYDFNICSSTQTFQGVCFGDSGSPVVAGGKAVGIVNWIVPCAVGAPDVHSRISSFMDWINEQIASN